MTSVASIQERLDHADSVAHWFLELAEGHSDGARLDAALDCVNTAAWILARQNRRLGCERLEGVMQAVAGQLPATAADAEPHPPTCLHVLSEALPAGGITALAMRWMRADDVSGCRHSAVLLNQQSAVPAAFAEAVAETGGHIYAPVGSDSPAERASWLRALARSHATCVIAHVGFTDIVTCGAAFGVPGGPPVMLVNHSANLYWPGASFVDLVANVRGSELETHWTTAYRAIPRCATLPIPMDSRDVLDVGEAADGTAVAATRTRARQQLDLPPEAVVCLTVGAHFKYLPTSEMDFVSALEAALQQDPHLHLLAVGFEADERWQAASARTGSRIKVLGVLPQTELADVRLAADIYVEGFPFGTTTALLEAGLGGLPAVLAPMQCPPPYGSDGVSLDDVLARPATVSAYVAEVTRLAADRPRREALGRRLRASIFFHHCGPRWSEYLEQALGALPAAHRTYRISQPEVTPARVHEHWSRLMDRWNSPLRDTFDNAVVRALGMGIRPHLTRHFAAEHRGHRARAAAVGVPLPLALVLCNVAFKFVPSGAATQIFRACSFLCRPGLFGRMAGQARLRLLRDKDPRQWYGDYRNDDARSDSGAFHAAAPAPVPSTTDQELHTCHNSSPS